MTTDENGVYKEIYTPLVSYIMLAVYSTINNKTLVSVDYKPIYVFPALYQGMYGKLGGKYSVIQLYEISDSKLIRVNREFGIKIYFYCSK